jgi:hypothetical protein
MLTLLNVFKISLLSFILKVIFTNSSLPEHALGCFEFYKYTTGGIITPKCELIVNYCGRDKMYEIRSVLKNNDTFIARSEKLSSFSDIVMHNPMSCDCIDLTKDKTICASDHNSTHGIARFKYLNLYYKTFIEIKDWPSHDDAINDISIKFDSVFNSLYSDYEGTAETR